MPDDADEWRILFRLPKLLHIQRTPPNCVNISAHTPAISHDAAQCVCRRLRGVWTAVPEAGEPRAESELLNLCVYRNETLEMYLEIKSDPLVTLFALILPL